MNYLNPLEYINNVYGSKRALVRYYKYTVYGIFGAYSHLMDIDWASAGRLVFVCKGNICRSPYAEAYSALKGVEAVSFGLEAKSGSFANDQAIKNASARDIDLSSHRSISVMDVALKEGDVLLAMEPLHILKLHENHIPCADKMSILGLWGDEYMPYLADPYGKSDQYFQTCFKRIENCVDNILAYKLKNNTHSA